MTGTSTPSADDVIRAAMGIARDAAEGRLDPAALERQAVTELRGLVDLDAPPDSELAGLQAAVARRALAAGLLPADELAEWLQVARSRAEAAEPSDTRAQG